MTSDTKKCIICTKLFKDEDNIGQLMCHGHHGRIIRKKWSCCGVSTGNITTPSAWYVPGLTDYEMGCVSMDHRTTYIPWNSINGIKTAHARYKTTFKIKEQAYEDIGNQTIKIYRFDRTYKK